MTNNHGGARKGSGRKPTGRKANIAKLVYFTQEDIDHINIIKSYAQNHINREIKNDSEAIRYALRYTAFKFLL